MLDSLSVELKNSLEDIVNKIAIGDNFQISHQDYHPVAVSSEMVAKLQRLPVDFQKQYLARQLRNYLADIYFRGCLRPVNLELNSNNLPLANNSIKGVDRDFYEQLETNNYGTGYFDLGWLVIKEKDDSLAVKKNELTLQIQRDRHLQKSDFQATVNDTVAIKLPNNSWQDEFYVAVSNSGLVEANSQQQAIEIYFNINLEGAIILLREVTQQLNERKIVFTLKILDDPNDYPCYDAAILIIYREDYLKVYELIKNIYPNLISYLNKATPICTFKLADGIALAEVTEKGFANICCGAIAQGLLTAWYEKDNSPRNRIKYISEELSLAKINLQHPYLNNNCDRFYQPLT
ncbi:MAG: hypothetical protein Tsb0014_11820 [Pleurocapsa sp.]